MRHLDCTKATLSNQITFFSKLKNKQLNLLSYSTLIPPAPDFSCAELILFSKMVSVLVVGHSYVFWTRQYAKNCGIDKDLGFPQVDITWIGQRGLKWHQLLPLLEGFVDSKHPNLIILHCGGNNIGTMTRVDLEIYMKETFTQLFKLYPLTCLCTLIFVKGRNGSGLFSFVAN